MPRTPKLFKEKTLVVGVRFPLSLKKQLEKLAEKNRRSSNQEILLTLEAGLVARAPTKSPPSKRKA